MHRKNENSTFFPLYDILLWQHVMRWHFCLQTEIINGSFKVEELQYVSPHNKPINHTAENVYYVYVYNSIN